MVDQRRDYIALASLVCISLLNNIDRFTVAGVLTDIQHYYKVNDAMGGLISTIFLSAYMISSPICGYLGDRYSRKIIIIVGMVVWLSAVFASTWVPSNMFWLFLVLRGVFGVGEASYANLSPSIIADLFTEQLRTRMYMIYYLGIPVGSGLGFVIGSNFASWLGSWQWGVRITGVAGIVVFALLLFCVYEPERGASEVSEVGKKDEYSANTSYLQDMKALLTTPTYVIATVGYTCLVFVTGTMTWWFPTILQHSEAWRKGLNNSDLLPKSDKNQIGLIFGTLASAGGLVGVIVGSIIAQCMVSGTGIFRLVQTPRAYPLVSGTGAAIGIPIFIIVVLFGHSSQALTYIMLFFETAFLSFNWGLNVVMINNIVLPCRRSTAFSYFILSSHLFGDASGPYIIGAISDAILRGKQKPYTPEDQYKSLIKAVSICIVLLSLSALFYFIATLTFMRDKRKFERDLGAEEKGKDKDGVESNGSWHHSESEDSSCYKRDDSIASYSACSQHF